MNSLQLKALMEALFENYQGMLTEQTEKTNLRIAATDFFDQRAIYKSGELGGTLKAKDQKVYDVLQEEIKKLAKPETILEDCFAAFRNVMEDKSLTETIYKILEDTSPHKVAKKLNGLAGRNEIISRQFWSAPVGETLHTFCAVQFIPKIKNKKTRK